MWITLSLAMVVAAVPTRASDDKPEDDPYQSVWSSLSKLLRRREYGSASGLMESVSDDPELQYQSRQIEADKEVIAGLQALEKLVAERLAALPEGAPVEISGVECEFIRYEVSTRGDRVVLKSKSTGFDLSRRIVELPAALWMQLAGPQLESLNNPDLILGVFAGFDGSADATAARRLLNQAASKGADVTVWLARLEAAEAAAKLPSPDRKTKVDDPLVGRWRVAVGQGDQRRAVNVEYRANGSAVRFLSREALRDNARRGRPIAFSITGRWQRLDDGTYKVTYSNGDTSHFELEEDRYWGRTAGGHPLAGTRQLTK